MRKVFHNELIDLTDRLKQMADHVAVAMHDATEALLTQDLELAEKVIAADHSLDLQQLELDEQAVDMLARQAPVATDLRTVVAALRMSATLERMGDLAEHVALTARRRYPEPVATPEVAEIFRDMGRRDEEMVRMAASVIETRDLKLAALVEKKDDLVDAGLQQIFDVLFAEDYAGTAGEAVDLTLVSRFYERFGDHAVSLVKRVGFLVTGEELDPHVGEEDEDD